MFKVTGNGLFECAAIQERSIPKPTDFGGMVGFRCKVLDDRTRGIIPETRRLKTPENKKHRVRTAVWWPERKGITTPCLST